MRPRPPSQLITYLEISNSPPPIHSPTIDTYAVLDHIICRIEHQTYFRSIKSLPSVPLPWFHRRYLLGTKLQLPYFTNPRPLLLLLHHKGILPPPTANSSINWPLSTPSISFHLSPTHSLLFTFTQTDLALTNTTFLHTTQQDWDFSLKVFT